ncbi:MAG TPA: alpha/beta hydrolase [Thermoanaerobaculia bacterium]|nr:alpha/beta hydrolase [Thermoanaerobaculia bacterium]
MKWKTIRRVWITFGIIATILFNGWMLFSSRAQGFDKRILASDERVRVRENSEEIVFEPVGGRAPAGLIFFPGGMVDPEAYAPLTRAVAEEGYEAVILKLPFRRAFLESQEMEVVERARGLMERDRGSRGWVVAGHSRGGVIACRVAATHPSLPAALVLIGTSHPVDRDLSGLRFPVTKIYAMNDGLATVQEVEANRGNLPASTRWVRIEGGNHGQFGWYGRQLGDGKATISREEQQARTVEVLLGALREISGKMLRDDR